MLFRSATSQARTCAYAKSKGDRSSITGSALIEVTSGVGTGVTSTAVVVAVEVANGSGEGNDEAGAGVGETGEAAGGTGALVELEPLTDATVAVAAAAGIGDGAGVEMAVVVGGVATALGRLATLIGAAGMAAAVDAAWEAEVPALLAVSLAFAAELAA